MRGGVFALLPYILDSQNTPYSSRLRHIRKSFILFKKILNKYNIINPNYNYSTIDICNREMKKGLKFDILFWGLLTNELI